MGEIYVVCSWDKAAKMLYESEVPTGVVVLSNSYHMKNRFVYSTLEKVFGTMVCLTSGSCSPERLKTAFEESRVVCASLIPEEVHRYKRQSSMVSRLRDAGAKTVYGVYLDERDTVIPEGATTPEEAQSPALINFAPIAKAVGKLIVAID